MTKRVQKDSLICSVVVFLVSFTSAVAALPDSPPDPKAHQQTDAALLDEFKQSLLVLVGGSVAESEITADFEVVRSSLIPLLLFSQKNVALRNALLACVKTLLMAGKEMTNPVLIRDKQNEALVTCQEEFVFFCTTTEQYETISRSLSRLGLYYAPLNAAFTQAHNHLRPDTGDRNFKVTAIVIGSVAVIALVYALSR